MRRRWSALLMALGVTLPVEGRAAENGDDYQAQYSPPSASRRSDFVLGLHLGAGFGSAAGFPNEVDKIDNPAFLAETGLGGGMAGSGWIGAALRDFFVFGIGFAGAGTSSAGLSSSSVVFVSHLEGYPLFEQGGLLRDLGLYAEFGAGGRAIENEEGEVVGEAPFLSSVAGGVVFEPLRLGQHFAVGGVAGYTHQFSQTMTAHLGLVGIRTVFYSGP